MKRVLSVFSFAVFSMFAFVCTASASQGNRSIENVASPAYPPIFIVVKNMPYTEAQLQKYAPQGYDCGYVMKDPYGSFLYGIFLVKEEGNYNLVYKNAGKVLTKSIPQELADKLATSAKTILKNASVPYTKTDNGGNNNDDVEWVEFYDGNYAYALVPDKIAECQTGEFIDIPDKAWMDEVIKFKEDLKNDDVDYVDFIDDEFVGMPNPEVLQDQDGVYLVVPEMPEYPDGAAALLSSFRETLVYPEDAKAEGIQGRVLVQFIVEEDGSITNPVIIKSVYPSLDAEALRFVSKMPKWKPGKIDGKPCRTKYIVPLNFRLN
jgi:protein TonB